MNFLKSVKGKVMVGIAAVGIFAFAGFALANSDAGQALKDWYDRVFNNAVEESYGQAEAYGENARQELAGDIENRKNHADGIIDRNANKKTDASIVAINNAKDSHLASLDGAKEEILEQMDFQFYHAFLEGMTVIDQKWAEAREFVTQDLAAHFGEKEEAVLAEMTEQINTAKENAVSELEAAIEAAKGEITTELDSKSDNLVYNLTTQIDHKVEELRREVKSIIANYQNQIETVVAAKAEELQLDAFQAMDDVVAGINN